MVGSRPSCTKKLLKAYLSYSRENRARLRRRGNHLRHFKYQNQNVYSRSRTGSLSSMSVSSHFESTNSENDVWSDILGVGWRLRDQSSATSKDLDDADSDGVPSLNIVSSDSDSKSGIEDESDDDTWDYLSEDADDERSETGSEEEEEEELERPCGLHRLRQWVQHKVEAMYSHRYEQPRTHLPRAPSHLHHRLHV
jgi:hypothetical protein